ncbi:hypothetical protein SPFM15_00131 [Salmonella phage SPFM15]|nr:hypothetical protein SPFM15_00131 [Salmonella phage SPFM15]
MAFTIRWTNILTTDQIAQPSKITLGDTNGDERAYSVAVTGMASVKIRPIAWLREASSDSPRPLLAATDNAAANPRPLVFNTDNTESATPTLTDIDQNESLRVVPITETSNEPVPLIDEGAELTWAPSVVNTYIYTSSGFWPILEMFDVARHQFGADQAYYQSISASYRSYGEWGTLSTTDANFLDYVWLKPPSITSILSLTSKLGSVNVHYFRMSIPYYTENAAAPDWSYTPVDVEQLKYMVKRDDEGTLYNKGAIFDSGDAGPRPKSTLNGAVVFVPTRAICNVTWADALYNGTTWPNRYAIKWLKFFYGFFGLVSAEELFTSDEMVYIAMYPKSGPGPKGLMAGNELAHANSLCYTGSCKMTYVYEPITSPNVALMKYATPETVTLTHAEALPAFNELNGLNLTASDLASLFKSGPKMASIPRSAQTVGKPGKGFAGEITVYYDRLNGVRGVPVAKNVNGRNTQITLCQQIVRDNPSLAGKITADSISYRNGVKAMGLYTEPSMELLELLTLRVSGSQPRCSLLLN